MLPIVNHTKGTTMRTLSTSTRRIARTLVASTALALLASACGSDAKSADTAPATTAAATTAAPTTVDHTTMDHSSTPAAGNAATAGVIVVTASDYHFEGIPAEIAAGSKLAVTNSSTKEFHELVVFHDEGSLKRFKQTVFVCAARNGLLVAPNKRGASGVDVGCIALRPQKKKSS